MSGIATAIVGGALITGVMGSQAAGKAAGAQRAASQDSIAEQRRQFDIANQQQQPWLVTGSGAENALARLYGLPYSVYGASTPSAAPSQSQFPNADFADFRGYGSNRGGRPPSWRARLTMQQNGLQTNPAGGVITPSGPDMSGFFNSPSYNFIKQEGMNNLGNSFAAKGGAFSGNALRGLTDFNQNLASQDYYNFVNQLNSMAGNGQNAANQGGNYAMQLGANVGNALTQQGDARASGILGQSNSWGNALNNGLNNWMLYKGGFFGGGGGSSSSSVRK